jgi:hypothetical protein
VLPSLVLWGLANGVIQPSLFGTASAAPADALSSASAVLTTARQLGSAFGVAVLVAVLGDATTLDVADLRRGWLLVIASALVTLLTGLRKSAAGNGIESEPAPTVAGAGTSDRSTSTCAASYEIRG